MARYDEYDRIDPESYDRPRRRTRPRTKDRPTYDDAVEGRVVTVDRGRYTTLVDGRTVMAMKSRPLGRKGVVVGDGCAWSATSPATTARWPGSWRSTSGARCCAAPQTTTTPSSG